MYLRTQTLGAVIPKNHCTSAHFSLFLVITVNYFSREETLTFPSFYPFSLSLCLFSSFLVLFLLLVLKVIKAKILSPKGGNEKSLVRFLVIPVIFLAL